MAEKVLKKFVISIGEEHKALTEGLKAADNSITEFISKVKGSLATFGLGAGLFEGIKQLTELSEDLGRFSEATGIAVEDVSRLGGALQYFGGNAETAKSTLKGIQDLIRQARDWGQGSLLEAGRKYGLMTTGQESPLEMLKKVADKLPQLNNAQQIDLASMLGLDQSTLLLLKEGRSEIDKMMNDQKGLMGLTKEDAEAAHNWEIAIVKLKQIFISLGRELARAILPIIVKLTKFMEGLAEKFKANQGLIDKIGSVIKNNLVPAFAFAALNIARSLAPLAAELLPLTMIALLIDDIAVFMAHKGGKSVIGYLLGDKGDEVREELKNLFGGVFGMLKKLLTGDFKGAFDEFEKLWTKDIIPLAAGFGAFLVKSIIENIPKMITELSKIFPKLVSSLKDIVVGFVISFVGLLVDTLNSITSTLGFKPLFHDENGNKITGDDVGNQLASGFVHLDGIMGKLMNKFDKLFVNSFAEGLPSATDVNREYSAEKYNIKPRRPITGSGINTTSFSNSGNNVINKNYQITFNTTGNVSENVVKNGIKSAERSDKYDIFNSLSNAVCFGGQ